MKKFCLIFMKMIIMSAEGTLPTDFSIKRNYSQVPTRPKNFKVLFLFLIFNFYCWGRVRSATQKFL